MNQGEYETRGRLNGIEITESAPGASRAWKKGTLKLTTSEGEKKTSSFDDLSIQTANTLIGQDVVLLWKFDKSNKYSNLINGSLRALSPNEPVQEETIGQPQTVLPPPANPVYPKQPTVYGKGTPNPQPLMNYDDRRQTLICRQSADKAALEFMKMRVEAVKAGILKPEEVKPEDLQLDKLFAVSKALEDNVMRNGETNK